MYMLSTEQERRVLSPTYQAWVAEQERLEVFAAAEEDRLCAEEHRRWEEEDKASVIRWKELQIKLEQIKAEKLKQEVSSSGLLEQYIFIYVKRNNFVFCIMQFCFKELTSNEILIISCSSGKYIYHLLCISQSHIVLNSVADLF